MKFFGDYGFTDLLERFLIGFVLCLIPFSPALFTLGESTQWGVFLPLKSFSVAWILIPIVLLFFLEIFRQKILFFPTKLWPWSYLLLFFVLISVFSPQISLSFWLTTFLLLGLFFTRLGDAFDLRQIWKQWVLLGSLFAALVCYEFLLFNVSFLWLGCCAFMVLFHLMVHPQVRYYQWLMLCLLGLIVFTGDLGLLLGTFVLWFTYKRWYHQKKLPVGKTLWLLGLLILLVSLIYTGIKTNYIFLLPENLRHFITGLGPGNFYNYYVNETFILADPSQWIMPTFSFNWLFMEWGILLLPFLFLLYFVGLPKNDPYFFPKMIFVWMCLLLHPSIISNELYWLPLFIFVQMVPVEQLKLKL